MKDKSVAMPACESRGVALARPIKHVIEAPAIKARRRTAFPVASKSIARRYLFLSHYSATTLCMELYSLLLMGGTTRGLSWRGRLCPVSQRNGCFDADSALHEATPVAALSAQLRRPGSRSARSAKRRHRATTDRITSG